MIAIYNKQINFVLFFFSYKTNDLLYVLRP